MKETTQLSVRKKYVTVFIAIKPEREINIFMESLTYDPYMDDGYNDGLGDDWGGLL